MSSRGIKGAQPVSTVAGSNKVKVDFLWPQVKHVGEVKSKRGFFGGVLDEFDPFIGCPKRIKSRSYFA